MALKNIKKTRRSERKILSEMVIAKKKFQKGEDIISFQINR